MQAWALSQRLSASAQVSIHALVPKCPVTSAEMSWCRSVMGPNCPDTSAPVTTALVPKCLGTEMSWVRSVRLPSS